MEEKQSREAAISAKIAAIRAANEERERRHAEVEADKKLAEKKRSAVDVRNAAGPEGTPHSMPGGPRDPIVGPPKVTPGNVRRSVEKTGPTPPRSSAQDRLKRDDSAVHVKSRIGDKDGPPPDPGYSFLADRMREDSNPEEDYDRGKQRLERRADFGSHKAGGQGQTRTEANSRYRVGDDRQRRYVPDSVDGDSMSKSLRPPHPFSNGTAPPDRAGSLPPRESGNRYMLTGFAQQDSDQISRPFANNTSSPTARQSMHLAQLPTSPPRWRCPDPSCANHNSPGTMTCTKCFLPWEKAETYINKAHHRRVKEESKGLTIEVQFDKMEDEEEICEDENGADLPTTTKKNNINKISTALSNANDEVHSGFLEHNSQQRQPPVVAQHLQQQLQVEATPVNSWTAPFMTTLPVGQWSNEPPAFTQTQPAHWSHQQEQHQPLVDHYVIGSWVQPQEQQQQQWAGNSMQSWTNDTGIAWVQHPGYASIQTGPTPLVHAPLGPPPTPFVHIPYSEPAMMIPMGGTVDLIQQTHQNVTQITQHNLPIMATQPFIPTRSQAQFYNNSTSSTSSMSNRSSYSRYTNTSSFSDGSLKRPGSSSNPQWREREVSKIPPRFQKQRMPVRQQPATRPSLDQKLPRAETSTAPPTAQRFSVFGTSNIITNINEANLAKDLGVPVRLIPAANCSAFREKIGLVDPALDRFVLVHGLCNDAQAIALHATKTDLEKGAESDQMALEFTDIIDDLLQRIPYLSIFISTLLPRFDHEDRLTMSNPNNVRKVMNVEILSRLAGNERVVFINNDLVLEWWKDEVKRNRLFNSDGHQLTPYGFSLMLDHWMSTLKPEVSKANLTKIEFNESVTSSLSASPMEEHVLSPPFEGMTSKLASVAIAEKASDEHELQTIVEATTADAETGIKVIQVSEVENKGEPPIVFEQIPDNAHKGTPTPRNVENDLLVEADHKSTENHGKEHLDAEKKDAENLSESSEHRLLVKVVEEKVSAGEVPFAENDELRDAKVYELVVESSSTLPTDKEKDEFREKNNDELMEKELKKTIEEESNENALFN